ncbi:MAG: TIGR02265 family protein [Polyangiaceae bacterium]|nr:TIGR02265 family protein [Polyangiaceae bacterium]
MAARTEGSIKGSVLLARLAFVQEQRGAAGLDRVLEALPPTDKDLLQTIVLPSGWYPFDCYERLDAAIAEEMGEGDSIFKRLGEHSALHNLSATQRRYIKSRDPHGLLRQAASIYRLYYDTGERNYERVTDKRAVLRTVGSHTYSRADCLTVVGWHEKAILMCGATHAHVTETKCRARGDTLCEYVCEWD